MEAKVLVRDGGQVYPLQGITMWIKEDGSSTRNELGVAEAEVQPGSFTPPPHIHRAHEETFYILSGKLDFTVNGAATRLRAGDFIMVPMGVAHTFSNPTDKPARFLNTFTPARYAHYFAEIEALAKAGTLTPQSVGAVMAKYETDVVKPA